ncbi:DUF4884 domain-containing protein [Pseudomonas fluorescens]|uniref:Lipoprotein n=1 Tax=Pseudomonas fluorescens TaxID=294 RepID=A0A5E6RL74_PSEFL|nr:DUF4884 domain-containing protein [Pseudomonas fluorescens]VVM65745.1 hypothetical protein PS652_01514 [Pseudomonas fluorescens]
MTRLALCLLLLATLAGCREPDKPAATVVAGTYKVDKLFTVDGCTVYRFLDSGSNKYFTNCSGTTAWSEDCGKGCDPQKGVPGGAHRTERQLSRHETQPEPTPALAPGRWIDERYEL